MTDPPHPGSRRKRKKRKHEHAPRENPPGAGGIKPNLLKGPHPGIAGLPPRDSIFRCVLKPVREKASGVFQRGYYL